MISFDKLTRIALNEATEFLHQLVPPTESIDLVVQLGSGQSPEGLLDAVESRASLNDMPYLPEEESLAQHKMEVLWGRVGDRSVLVYAGRYHIYEGYGRVPVILPIWAAFQAGAENFLFCNAAGSIDDDLLPGSFMVIDDHINNLAVSPLAGHQHLLESSYVDMSQTYCPELSGAIAQALRAEELQVHRGVYMANIGPHFETPAEIRFARTAGADAVGMSTVLEATSAHGIGGRVAGVSMIANRAAGLNDCKITHSEGLAIGRQASKHLVSAIRRWLLAEAPVALN